MIRKVKRCGRVWPKSKKRHLFPPRLLMLVALVVENSVVVLSGNLRKRCNVGCNALQCVLNLNPKPYSPILIMTIFLYILLSYVVTTILAILFCRWSNVVCFPESIPLKVCFVPVVNWFVMLIAIMSLLDWCVPEGLGFLIEKECV